MAVRSKDVLISTPALQGEQNLFKSPKCSCRGSKGPLVPDCTIHNNHLIGTDGKLYSTVPAVQPGLTAYCHK
jgi:hypothetical protein